MSPGGIVGSLLIAGVFGLLLCVASILLRGRRKSGEGSRVGAWFSLGMVSRDWSWVSPLVAASYVILFQRNEIGNSALPWDSPGGASMIIPFLASAILVQEALIWHWGRSFGIARRLGLWLVRIERMTQIFCLAVFGVGISVGEGGWLRWFAAMVTVASVGLLALRSASDRFENISPEMKLFLEGS